MKTNLTRIQQDIENLSKFNATPGSGLTRFTFTKEDCQAREYIKEEMKNAGLNVYEDLQKGIELIYHKILDLGEAKEVEY